MFSGLAKRVGSSASRALQNRFNPFSRNPSTGPPRIPGMPGISGMPRLPVNLGQQGPQRGVAGKGTATTKVTIAKIVTLVLLSAFIGVFFMYLYKKEKEFNFDVIDKGIVVVALLLSGIAHSN